MWHNMAPRSAHCQPYPRTEARDVVLSQAGATYTFRHCLEVQGKRDPLMIVVLAQPKPDQGTWVWLIIGS